MTYCARDSTHPGLVLSIEIGDVHHHEQTEYQDVLIAETPAFGRALFMDGILQSAEYDEAQYHAALVHPAMFSHPKPRRVLIGGGGEGATLRDVLRHPQVETVTMVDIDERAVRACKEHLQKWHQGAFDDPRARLVHDDVRRWLAKSDERFDVVILDLGDPSSSESSILASTRQFYEIVRAAMADGGVVALQAGEYDGSAKNDFGSFTSTLRRAFSHVRPYRLGIASFCSVWGFALAAMHEIPRVPPDLDERFRLAGGASWTHYDPEGHRAMMWLSRAERQRLEDGGRVLTDHSPLDLAGARTAEVWRGSR